MQDVIVIGGGLAGCASAYYLARAGASVLLLEQGELNRQASGSNAGSLHAQIPHDPFVQKGELWARSFVPAVRLLNASLALWKGLENELDTELETRFGGGLLVASNGTQMRQIEAKAKLEREAGLRIDLLDAEALRREAPYLSADMIGGAICPDEGKANPLLAGPAFAAAAMRRGAAVRRREQVLGVSRSGQEFEVSTSTGQYRAPRIVCAAGVETGRLAGHLGAQLQIQGFSIQVSVTEVIEPLVPHLLYYAREKLTLKQARNGSILIGGGWAARLDAMGRPISDPTTLAQNLAVALEVVPVLSSVRLVRTWAALVNGTEDWLPIIGELPQAPGFFINYVPWLGFSGGPAAARLTASLVLGEPPPFDFASSAFAPK